MMSKQYKIHCECGAITATLQGTPKVKGHCHCEDCRLLLNTPFHSVTAWNKEQLLITCEGPEIIEYQHPQLEMKRAYCSRCGETIFNTNARDWRVVSQHLIRKCNNGVLPGELSSDSHFFYGARVLDIDDQLPKHE